MASASSLPLPGPILDLAFHDDENQQYLPSGPLSIGRLLTVETQRQHVSQTYRRCRTTIIVELAGTTKKWLLIPSKFCAGGTVQELDRATFVEYLIIDISNVSMMRLNDSIPKETLCNYVTVDGVAYVPRCRRRSTQALLDTDTVLLHRDGSYLTIQPCGKAFVFSDKEMGIKDWVALPIDDTTAAQLLEADIGALVTMPPVMGKPRIEACGTYSGMMQYPGKGTCLIVAPLWVALNELGLLPEFAPGQLRVLLPVAKVVNNNPVTRVPDATPLALDSLKDLFDTGYDSQ